MKEIFISYAHDNLDDREELVKHLTILKRKGLINDWSDKKLIAGENWDQMIKKKLDDADIVLFLVSSEFLASDYIHNVEVEETIKRYHENTVQVFPVILNNCMWRQTKLNSFQAVPSDEGRLKPISEWADKNKAYYTVSIELLKSINRNSVSDELVAEAHKYKNEISGWGIQDEKPSKINLSVSIDELFKLVLIIFLFLFGFGCFYTILIMNGELSEKLPIIVMFSILLSLSILAYFSWKYLELKQVKTELSSKLTIK